MCFRERYLPAYLPAYLPFYLPFYLPRRSHYPATTTSLPCYHNIIALLRQHHCPATATSLSCYGNIMLLLFNALSWLFSVLVVKLIEPIKVKKRASIVRLCEIFGVYVVDYVKFWVLIVQIMWNFWYLWCGLCEKQGRLCGGLCENKYSTTCFITIKDVFLQNIFLKIIFEKIIF